MNRTTISLIVGTTALAAVTGFASISTPDASDAGTAKAAAQLPVERTSLLCPAPSTSDLAETAYTSFTPVTEGTRSDGKAELAAATAESATGAKGKGKAKAGKPVLTPKEPGKPVTGDTSGGDAPALVGTAEGKFAPGWTVQETTEVAAGTGRGLLGVNCTVPDTEFWFPGASTAAGRTDYVHLTNPDDSAAVVDIELYGKDGNLKSEAGEGITVPPHGSEPILLSTLSDAPQADLTVRVNVRSGRVGAAVQALDAKTGGDWLTASTEPADSLVLPGIPKDATSVRLIAFAPSENDADLKVRLASPTGLITPVGNETLHIKAGMTTAVDLGDLTTRRGGLPGTHPDRHVGAVRRRPGSRTRQGRPAGDRFHPGDGPGLRARDGRRQPRQGHHALPDRPGQRRPGEGHGVRGQRGRHGGDEDVHDQGRHHPGRRTPRPRGLKGTYALTVERVSGGAVYAVPDARGPGGRRPDVHGPDAAGRPGDGGGAGRGAGPVGPAEVTAGAKRSPRGDQGADRGGRCQSSPYRGSTVSGVSPSNSATCSTTTSWTRAARSSRPLVRISTGRR